jgi:endonuclease-3
MVARAERRKAKRRPTEAKKSSDRRRKSRFNIETVLNRIRVAITPFPKAALFELAADGFDSTFEQLVACIISIRTRDEVTVPTARELFAAARHPREMAKLPVNRIDRLILPARFTDLRPRRFVRSPSEPIANFMEICRAMKRCYSRFAGSARSVRILCWELRATSRVSAWIFMCIA